MRFFELYHARSQQMPPFGPPGTEPESWKIVKYKEYPALSRIALSKDAFTDSTLTSALKNRTSLRNMMGGGISREKISQLLLNGVGLLDANEGEERIHAHHRPYPSAGSRYPLEVYILLLNGADIEAGLYHYAPHSHELVRLGGSHFLENSLLKAVGFPWATKSSMIVFFSGVFERIVEKYGERGYRLALLEAGHAAQNLLLLAVELDLKACALGLADETLINDGLGLDGVSEGVVHSVAFGI